ncbi:MAG: hypothetical protein J5497_02705 [Selenomonadaceae bacterium]|nr:hypothetical protein [Selenomonadaceae bacterium]
MPNKKFAFESGKISIAFGLGYGLGDSVVAKKIFDSLVEIEPSCVFDIFCKEPRHFDFAKAFYGFSKNLNRILSHEKFYEQNITKYSLAVWVVGTHCIMFDGANIEQLKKSPALLNMALQVQEYNNRMVKDFKPLGFSVPLRNVCISRILHKNFFWFLSCGGILPIHDEQVEIPLSPDYQHDFNRLKLDKYITIYSNIHRQATRRKSKSWSMKYLVEYVAAVKKNFPALKVIQVGGRDELEIPNVDEKFLGVDLELTKYILANSLLNVGCEGGLIHLATALKTTCLVFFGSSDWHYFAYERNINIASSICEPCMYIAGDYGCVLEAEEPPCMLDITPQEALIATSDYLKNNT